MASYASVQAFAARVGHELARIDIVLLNAGCANATYAQHPETGHEMTLQVNYLSTALLVILLLPVLKAKRAAASEPDRTPPVLSVVGSDTAYMTTIEARDDGKPMLRQLDQPPAAGVSSRPFETYARTKLLLALFVARLAEVVSPDHVLLQLVNPGLTKGTGLGREGSWIEALLLRAVQAVLARSVDVGASTYVDAVVSKG
jgi:NAD(P)-dependent dehydrogenase (short-subunit alcohol dehydrogenase family)